MIQPNFVLRSLRSKGWRGGGCGQLNGEKNQNQDIKIPGTVSNIPQKSLLNVTRTKNYDTCLSFLPPKILRSSSLHLESSTPRHPHLPPPGFLLTGTRIVFTKRRIQRYRLFKERAERFTVFPPFLVFQQLFKLNWDSSLHSLLKLKTPIGTPTSFKTSFPIKAKAPKPIPCQQRFLSRMASSICEVVHVACQSRS